MALLDYDVFGGVIMVRMIPDINPICIENDRERQEFCADQLASLDFDCLEALLQKYRPLFLAKYAGFQQ
jgi:hypothetical protein